MLASLRTELLCDESVLNDRGELLDEKTFADLIPANKRL